MGFLGGPTDRVGCLFNFFVRPLSKLCISDAHLCVREKPVTRLFNTRWNLEKSTSLMSRFTRERIYIFLNILQASEK